MLTSEEIKKYAKNCGADIVGVTSMDRFEGAPKQMDPRFIFPDAKSMIVLGFRIFRGVYRGIEEGTFFTAYSAMGYAGINYIYQPYVLWNVSKMIEDEGYEAIQIPNNFPFVNAGDTIGIDRERIGKMDPNLSRPVSPDKPAPDVFPHLRIAAFCAGLGQIGYSKMFLTPEFGPRQRIAAIITDAPLEPDPLFNGELCDRCMLCVKACSMGAISRDKTVKITVAGRQLEWADIDYQKCSVGFCGGSRHANPFMVTPKDRKGFTHPDFLVAQQYKLPAMYVYARALEGAAGCTRACMIHLEKTGKIKNVFKSPFRKRKPWVLR